MNTSPTDDQADQQRGTHYANGGIANVTVYYPDPERIARIHAEWEATEREEE